MSSFWENNLKITIFGQSHSAAVGATVDGFPSGFAIDTEKLGAFMERRAPGRSSLATQRREADKFEILSGIGPEGTTCGAPLGIIIRNGDTRPGDYDKLRFIPRPGHADYTTYVKFGQHRDHSGGGHTSGRLSAALCLVGGIALQYLESRGVTVGSHLYRVGTVCDTPFDPINISAESFRALTKTTPQTISLEAGERMMEEIRAAKEDCDSVGGIIECAAVGLPAGLGDPMFDGVENVISQLCFALGGVKGIEFGSGFAGSALRGSQNNDPFAVRDDEIVTLTNNHGGILGGITSGMPLVFRVAIKPTPTIFKEQQSVDLRTREEVKLSVTGRHDPCVALRAIPCIEAITAIALADLFIGENR